MSDLLQQIESAIPDERKNLSFGDEGEDITDVIEQMDRDSHERGHHENDPKVGCPLCEESNDD